ncbi:MAG: ATP-dependent Clp protease adapter ClpS [Alphaproteobacteria bacterium]|nr:ATP-dependent Clp protease adapter ClpS [Alphaproteobacteria bacterium]
MPGSSTNTTTRIRAEVARPKLHKVILLNDDYTPRDVVVIVLKSAFRMDEAGAHKVMLTAHQLGSCVVAVFTREIAETKANEANEAGRRLECPLTFTTEPEE